ncbi:MAG: type II toxin-antitoxin system HicA family toxin [Methylobacteriaceae bacterium]|nr:type II toxin-antitoxin system HicA family toxin [Methylobacteriaceae bacterium]
MARIETNRAEVIRRLERDGWSLQRHGSDHDGYSHPVLGKLWVPRHRRLSPGVARDIAKKAQWLS